MGCVFRLRLRCNELSSLWRTITCLLLQLYLLFLALQRYRLYTEMKWPVGEYPNQWLTVYIALLAACIPLLVLFGVFGLLKSGNMAGDGERLGDRSERVIELLTSRSRRRHSSCCFSVCHLMKSLWQHSCPLPQSIHLLVALLQLLAQQVMLAQLYRYGFINSGDFLNTELDFAYQRARQLATNLPMGDTRLQGFRITADELADSPIAPNLLPMPLEFVNLLIALIAYSCAYPSVFWRLSKPFSLCFSVYMLIHSASLIFSYISWSILFRVQETNYFSVRPVGIGQHFWYLRPHLIAIYHPLVLIVTLIVTIVLIQLAPVVIYTYGYSKYAIAVDRCRRERDSQTGTTPATATSTIYHPSRGDRFSIGSSSSSSISGSSFCCDGYAPHVAAICLLALIVTAKAPALYAMMLLYQHEEKPILLSCIAADVVYLFGWILLWLLFTLKREWHFRVIHTVQEILTLQSAQLSGRGRSISQLKNALIVIHGRQMIVTDDPMEKGPIMRHALKMCSSSGATTMADDLYWTQKAVAAAHTHTHTHTHQSPATLNRKLQPSTADEKHQYCCSNYGHIHQPPPSSSFNERSPPELSRLLAERRTSHSPPAPMAAPPYHQRIASSLPPPTAPVNTFGTLQRNTRHDNDYGIYGSSHYGGGYGEKLSSSSTLGRPSTTMGRLMLSSSSNNYAPPPQPQLMRTGTAPSPKSILTGDGEVWRGPSTATPLNNGSIRNQQQQQNGTPSYNYQVFRVGGKTMMASQDAAVDGVSLKKADGFATSVV